MTTGSSRAVHPELARATAILRALAGALRSVPADLSPGVPDPHAAEVRVANGIPALTGEMLLSWESLLRNVARIAEALSATEAGVAAAAVLQRLERAAPLVDAEQLVQSAVEGQRDAIEALATPLGLDADALATVLDWAARPALRAAAAVVAPTLAQTAWSRGYCPACGAPPTLSVVRGKEHERRLHCGRCGTGWAFPRVRCPACGERNHERLGYLHAAGEGEYRRAEVCESCRGYVKSVALLDTPGADRVLELDLETAALDFLALDRGYARVPLEHRTG